MLELEYENGYIQLHFCTIDGSHSMDAAVLNKCIYEYLGIIKEVSTKYQLVATVESEALTEGGIRHWLKVTLPTKEAFKREFIMALLIDLALSPFHATIEEVTSKLVERLTTPTEILELQDEATKAELEYKIAWYKKETAKLSSTVNKNVIDKKKSNFYTSAKSCSKIQTIEFCWLDAAKETHCIQKIESTQFESLILSTDELEPKLDEEAIIEIVSPVLKKGKYKWTGIYKGEVISFVVKSNEFKTLIQTGRISFRNGTSIKCDLSIKRKLDEDGNEKIKGYEVLAVNEYFVNEKPVETPEGKRKRQQKEADARQLQLIFDDTQTPDEGQK